MLQLVGRDTETSAQVRYDAHPPSWSKRKGPSNMPIGYSRSQPDRSALTRFQVEIAKWT